MINPTEEDLGKNVIYGLLDSGVITSFNKNWVYVRYSNQHGSTPGQATKKEGDEFEAQFCDKCKKDDYTNGILCPILADVLIFSIDHKSYPKAWIYDDTGKPTCTDFEL